MEKCIQYIRIQHYRYIYTHINTNIYTHINTNNYTYIHICLHMKSMLSTQSADATGSQIITANAQVQTDTQTQ